MRIALESAHFACDGLHVLRLTGTSAISRLFSYNLEVAFLERGAPKPSELLGESVTIVLAPPAPGASMRVHGIIDAIDDHLLDAEGRRIVHLRVVPRAKRLALGASQEVYLDRNVPTLLVEKLAAVGLAEGGDVVLNLESTYPKRDFIVQYEETDLDFVCRLAEHVGISFYVEHHGDADRLVLTDHAGGFALPPREVPFHARGEQRGIFRLAVEHRMVPKTYTVHDYNYRLPQLAPLGSHELPADVGYAGDVIEVGPHAKTPEEAKLFARVRAEERQAGQLVYVGESAVPSLDAGIRLRVTEHPELDALDLTVVEVTHEATQGLGHGDARSAYTNRFRAIPGGRTFRPPRITRRPKIHGLVTGVIDASHGGDAVYAPIDDQGRYAVRFLFDLATPEGQVPSHAVRMIQNHAGAGYGTHLPLKPGVEVLLAFVNGDPDRPVIVGTVPNPLTPSPVNRTRADLHVMRTSSGTRIECK
jgi:type VI secretion system secreted protein VgrG